MHVKSSANMKHAELEDKLLSVYEQRMTRGWEGLGLG